LRRRQQGHGRGNVGITNPEQRACSRRFQDHLVAAPAQICEPRQDENVGLAELRHLRPVIRHLRLDDDVILALRLTVACAEAILQQAVPGQSPHQPMHLVVDGAAAGRKCAEWQTRAQLLRAIRRGGAELSKPTEWPWKQATMVPSERASRAT
jgi:hypothetical protein